MANNEISIHARTLNSVDMNEIRRIDLIFIGTEKSTNSAPISLPKSPPSNASIEEWEKYKEDMDKYANYMRELAESTTANTLTLNSETNYTEATTRWSEVQELTNSSTQIPLISILVEL